jgi:uncharacterized LabA/DUF88 family protein
MGILVEMVAILVDGGFYKVRARGLFGDKPAQERAKELHAYCCKHLEHDYNKDEKGKVVKENLYRIFYYDCAPLDREVYHPLSRQTTNLGRSESSVWQKAFLSELAKMRKIAIRLGELSASESGYRLKPKILNALCRNERTIEQLTDRDFEYDITQKGVDMRIGLDIASMANKRLVTQIVLISGDSDFVPAAKYARREGIDFVLDPMLNRIKDSLSLHIDGLQTHAYEFMTKEQREQHRKSQKKNIDRLVNVNKKSRPQEQGSSK